MKYPDFDIEYYKLFNNDLSNFDNNELRKHYFDQGIYENRIISELSFNMKYPDFYINDYKANYQLYLYSEIHIKQHYNIYYINLVNKFNMLNNNIFSYINVITVAKIGSTMFNTILYDHHYHSLNVLIYIIENKTNNLIISGIRNPIDRNISYFFETYNLSFIDIRMKCNDYKGEYHTGIDNISIIDKDTDQLIDLFYKQNYHTTFNNWFNEYFDILNFDINSNSFDKEKGWGIFKVKNNNYILLYTLEKINNLENELLKLDIKLKSENVADNKIYSKKYKEFKQKIKISDKYKKDLLNTDIMRFFYSDDDIKNMYKKYV